MLEYNERKELWDHFLEKGCKSFTISIEFLEPLLLHSSLYHKTTKSCAWRIYVLTSKPTGVTVSVVAVLGIVASVPVASIVAAPVKIVKSISV